MLMLNSKVLSFQYYDLIENIIFLRIVREMSLHW